MAKQIELIAQVRTTVPHVPGEKAELIGQTDKLGVPVFRVRFKNGETSYLKQEEFKVLVDIHNLAEFKRFLAEPGATIVTLQHSFAGHMRDEKLLEVLAPRTIKTVQSTQFQFSNGAWMQFGKASDWTFEGDTVTFKEDDLKIVYKLFRE